MHASKKISFQDRPILIRSFFIQTVSFTAFFLKMLFNNLFWRVLKSIFRKTVVNHTGKQKKISMGIVRSCKLLATLCIHQMCIKRAEGHWCLSAHLIHTWWMHNIILREGSWPSEKATVSVVVKLIIGFLVKIALKPDFFEN